MKPSFSLIFFTVLSGAGFGMFVLLYLVERSGIDAPLTADEFVVAGVLSLVLVTAGLLSSTGHLANPRNAVKAFNRLRTSWLSREGALSLAFFPFALAYLAATWWNAMAAPAWAALAGALAVLTALATLFATGMIYASLKAIRQWHNPLVPANYIALGLASGAVLLTAVRALYASVLGGGQVTTLAALGIGLLLAAGLIKLLYYFWVGLPAGPTIQTATGLTRAQVRLLDTGHSFGTFLTREFAYRMPRRLSPWLRSIALSAVVAVPLAALIPAVYGTAAVALAVALAVMLVGLLLERWLFFAEAVHAVNLYHGRTRT